MIREEDRAYSNTEPKVFCRKEYSSILPIMYKPEENIILPIEENFEKEFDSEGRIIHAYSTLKNNPREVIISYNEKGLISKIVQKYIGDDHEFTSYLKYDDNRLVEMTTPQVGLRRVVEYNDAGYVISDICTTKKQLYPKIKSYIQDDVEGIYFEYDGYNRMINVWFENEFKRVSLMTWEYWDDNSIKFAKSKEEEYYFNKDGIKVIRYNSDVVRQFDLNFKDYLNLTAEVNVDGSYCIYNYISRSRELFAKMTSNGNGIIYKHNQEYKVEIVESGVSIPLLKGMKINYFEFDYASEEYEYTAPVHNHYHIYDSNKRLVGSLYMTKDNKYKDIYIPVFGTIYEYYDYRILKESFIHEIIDPNFNDVYNIIKYKYNDKGELFYKRFINNSRTTTTTTYFYKDGNIDFARRGRSEYVFDENGNIALIKSPKRDELDQKAYQENIILHVYGVKKEQYTINDLLLTFNDEPNKVIHLDLLHKAIDYLDDKSKSIFEGFIKYGKTSREISDEFGIPQRPRHEILNPICRKIRNYYKTELVSYTKEHHQNQPDTSDNKVDNINKLLLSNRTYNALFRGGYKTLDKILSSNYNDLMSIKNFGKKSYDDLIRALKSFGFDTSNIEEEKKG